MHAATSIRSPAELPHLFRYLQVNPALFALHGAAEAIPTVAFVTSSVAQPADEECVTQSSDDNTSIKALAS